MKAFLKQFFDIKFWKFLLVGAFNTLVGEGLKFLLYFLTPIKQAGNFLLGPFDINIGTFAASAIGIIVGSVISYFLNKHFTFKNKEKGAAVVLRFALNIAVCWVIANIIALPLVSTVSKALGLTLLGWSVETTADFLSLAASSVLFVACNYVGQRFFAFREKESR